MKKRIELSIFKNKSIKDFTLLFNEFDLISVYIKVDLKTLSETRKKLIEMGYTTRLFIHFENGIKSEYVFGKLKAKNGVFKEHCKNSVFRKKIENLIEISSNKDDFVMIDDEDIKNNFMLLVNINSRNWIIL